MAAGTVVSRLSGFVRNAMLAAALGTALHADLFTIANTIPNMLYILLAGGVFNAVLVPQLVRAIRNDPDGGDGYTNRVITLAAVFLAGTTAVLVIAAPVLMRLFLDGSFFGPDLGPQRESVIDFARYCLPQVFFYGMFVLVAQVLNARGQLRADDVGPHRQQRHLRRRPGGLPVVVRLRARRVRPGRDRPLGAGRADLDVGAYTAAQELLLGLGCTLGIAVQLLILVPFLRRAGFRFRPRFDFRGTGLGHTLRLGSWTVAFVVVNQIAYTVVVRIASSGHRRGVHRRLRPDVLRHRLHDLLQRVPAGDGPALHRDGVAGHRHAAAPLVVRRRPRPRRGGAQRGRDAAHDVRR